MHLSVIGRKMAGLSGLRSIMDDIATVTLGSPGDWINLSVGNPAPIPEVLQFWQGLAAEVLETGDYLAMSGSYGPSRGAPGLVQAVVRYFNDRYGWGITQDNVVVGPGSQMLCFAAAALFTGPGSGRLVLPIAPDYTGYQAMCMQPDGVVGVPARARPDGQHHFSYVLDATGLRQRDDVGLLLVSSPSNPTGRCVTPDEQAALIDLAGQRDVPLILDQAYGQPFPQIAGTLTPPPWHPNVINTFTFSKAGLPGERIGVAIGPERFISPIVSFLANSVLHAPQLAQAVAARALDTGRIDGLVSSVLTPYYARRRAHAEKLLHELMPAGVDWRLHAGDGGMFCWLWIDEEWFDDLACYESLKQRRVFVVPGRHFFVPPASGVADPHARRCVRVSITTEESALAEGIGRIADALIALRETATDSAVGRHDRHPQQSQTATGART